MCNLYRQRSGPQAIMDMAKAMRSTVGNLAPGDFAALMRQHRFRPIKAVSQMVDLLKAEAALKGGYSRPIGFVH